ncbi:MAG: IlvD/Edd family dehydratase [Alphaproteobacteria bacterium]|nr:IlvD/Edd family dehydratase [Alphaproteobacteria bacterium]
MSGSTTPKKLRSQEWWDNPDNPGMTALYLERYLNFGLTRAELQSGKPIIGIAQTGSDLSPCNRHHLDLAQRTREAIRAAGGVCFEFPVHPIQETGKRPTAALDRNLAYLGLVELLYGYPIDGVVLTVGCDKTTPACLMAAATMNIPAIVLSGGPMLDGFHRGQELLGSGTAIWQARKDWSAGKIDENEFMEIAAGSAPSIGHCNTMGTASSMNAVAEALGMSLPGCAMIPAPYRERGQMAYATGLRIVEMVNEDLRPSDIMTRAAFENAIRIVTALGASSNCVWHLIAIARHMGVELTVDDWQSFGDGVPLLVNMQPAGKYLGEAFHKAGGVPAVMRELLERDQLNGAAMTVSGKSVAENVAQAENHNPDVILPYDQPMMPDAGYAVLHGNFFDTAVMKISVITDGFRQKYLSRPGAENVLEARAVVFEGSEDYHERINDPDLQIDENCMLFIRGTGPLGWPGSAEVVNMQPPDALIKAGVEELPVAGDGRQSGTSGSPSVLHISPESAVGGGLALMQTGDMVRLDLNTRRLDLLIDESEMQARRDAYQAAELAHQTPWQEIFRNLTGQLETGMVLEDAVKYQRISQTKGIPRDNH